MILLTLNIRGVGGTPKCVSLRRLLSNLLLDIVFFQETLVEDHKSRAFVSTLRPNWMVCVVSLEGRSGGLCVAWDPLKFTLSPFLSVGGFC
jgi:hypothetical protein